MHVVQITKTVYIDLHRIECIWFESGIVKFSTAGAIEDCYTVSDEYAGKLLHALDSINGADSNLEYAFIEHKAELALER